MDVHAMRVDFAKYRKDQLYCRLRKQYWDKLFEELIPVLCSEQRKNSDKREDLISSRIFLGGSR